MRLYKHILYTHMKKKGRLSFNFCVGELLLQTRNYVGAFAYDKCGADPRPGRENVLLVI